MFKYFCCKPQQGLIFSVQSLKSILALSSSKWVRVGLLTGSNPALWTKATQLFNEFYRGEGFMISYRSSQERTMEFPCQQVFKVVKKFITYEDHFSIAHLYQMRLLTHISSDDPLNLPYYLYNSLLKMSKRYQK